MKRSAAENKKQRTNLKMPVLIKNKLTPPAKKDRGVKNEKYITFYSVKSDKNMRRLQIIIDQQY